MASIIKALVLFATVAQYVSADPVAVKFNPSFEFAGQFRRLDKRNCGNNAGRCFKRSSVQAVPFCSTFLSLNPITISPVVTTVVVTNTNTVVLTETLPHATVTGAEIFTVTETSWKTLTLPCQKLMRRDAGINCLTSLKLSPAQVSSACTCLFADGKPITSQRATVIDPQTVTTTTVETATRTPYSNCYGYTKRSQNVGTGNSVVQFESPSALECCKACQDSLDCIANVWAYDTCQHLVNMEYVEGEERTDRCPLGVENYLFGDGDGTGVVYPGPCSVEGREGAGGLKSGG
ncbi:hypothetical protein TWF730_000797 [Orbilia blumenaviensis]|uniref:Apple domain-containing protein n=1 Tax=Orbilia blumenaviensis TaxID=1796055 RepID=A0AAV9VPX8_9PEZI